MIDLLAAQSSAEAATLVLAALQRSVTYAQARLISLSELDDSGTRILLVVNAEASQIPAILRWQEKGAGKVILFGRLPQAMAQTLGLESISWPAGVEWSRSAPAPTHGFAESAGRIVYTAAAEGMCAAHWQRPLERFDFMDEWNNLGYGAIRHEGNMWSLAQPLYSEKALAQLVVNDDVVASYALLRDTAECSTLWFNRAVGPIDSFEWKLLEDFLSSWRHEELPCQPVLADIPFGCEAAVTMRLDCDEDVDSARALRTAYNEMGVPFSLAVHTRNLTDATQHVLLKEMAAAGESILSHTATHAPNWGGSYEAALAEGRESCSLLQAVTGLPVRYAVSPFHQSPPYALAGLADAGLTGCIGGIIRNDPEFLLARGGLLAGLPVGFIGHSQQHMLHGDCLLDEGDALAISRQAFDRAFETGTLFGFLDHPFSARYQYGWMDEESRITAHRELIAHIRQRAPSVRFLSEDEAMDFLLEKSRWQVLLKEGGYFLKAPEGATSSLQPAIELAGRRFAAYEGSISA